MFKGTIERKNIQHNTKHIFSTEIWIGRFVNKWEKIRLQEGRHAFEWSDVKKNREREWEKKEYCNIDHIHDTWHAMHFHVICVHILRSTQTFICSSISCAKHSNFQSNCNRVLYFILFISTADYLCALPLFHLQAIFIRFAQFDTLISFSPSRNTYINQCTYACSYNSFQLNQTARPSRKSGREKVSNKNNNDNDNTKIDKFTHSQHLYNCCNEQVKAIAHKSFELIR